MNRDGGKKTTIRQSRKTPIRKNSPNMHDDDSIRLRDHSAAACGERAHPSATGCGASPWPGPSAAAALSIVICPFIDLSAKRLLLENRHCKNGSPNKTKGGHRTGKKRSTKELETVQTIRKKVVLESRKIRPRQRRGFFIDNFPDRQSRIQRFAASSISHALATSAAG